MASNHQIDKRNNDKNEMLASWLAGSKHTINILNRKFNRQEIDAINVPKLCDKLKQKLSDDYDNVELESNSADGTMEISQEKLKFVDYSRLVFGTLILHQQQVDYLLGETKKLLETTSQQISLLNKSVKTVGFQSHKMKQSSSISLSNPSRRYSLYREESQFLELYKEAELLAISNNHNEIDSFEGVFTCTQSVKISRHGYQMLCTTEIKSTVREFNEDDFNLGVEMDFQHEFGDASEHEKFFFMKTPTTNNLSDQKTDSIIPQLSARNRKRKLSYEIANENINPMDFLSIEMEGKVHKNNDLRASNPLKELNTNYIVNKSLNSASSINHKEKDTTVKQSFTNNLNDNSEMIPTTTSSLLSSNSEENYVVKLCQKTRKIIIDKSIKLNRQEIRTQCEAYYAELDYKVNLNPNQKSAEYLLTNFKLNKMFPSTLNNQANPTSDEFSNNYLLLVREILGVNYSESIANDIYPRWKKNQKLKRQSTTSSRSIESTSFSRNEENISILSPQSANNNADELENDNSNDYNDNNNNKYVSISPYDILIQLTNILSREARKEIEMSKFLNTLPSRMFAALAFRHILGKQLLAWKMLCPSDKDYKIFIDLVRDSYIIITTKPDTIEATNISLGPGSQKLLKQLKLN